MGLFELGVTVALIIMILLLNVIATALRNSAEHLENLAMTNRDMHKDSSAIRESLFELRSRDGWEEHQAIIKRLENIHEELSFIRTNQTNR